MMIQNFTFGALLGWPAVVLAVLLGMTGLLQRCPLWLLIATVAALPMLLYLGLTPRFAGIALLVPVSLSLAALALRRERRPLAIALFLPLPAFYAGVAVVVGSG